MALNTTRGKVLLIVGREYAGIVQRIFCEEFTDEMFTVARSRPRERPEFSRLIEPPQFPKELKQPDRSRIQDRWGRYK